LFAAAEFTAAAAAGCPWPAASPARPVGLIGAPSRVAATPAATAILLGTATAAL
jgi:hypothetical protein